MPTHGHRRNGLYAKVVSSLVIQTLIPQDVALHVSGFAPSLISRPQTSSSSAVASPSSKWRLYDAQGDDSYTPSSDDTSLVKGILNGVVRPSLFAASVAFATLSSQPVTVYAKDVSGISAPTSYTSEMTPSSNSAYDEAWTLVKKYALDQKFHGQNWDEAYKQYSSGVDLSSSDEDRIMKATTNLVGSLGDKYSRILDKDAYTRIQKFDLIGVGATLMPDAVTKDIIVGAPPVAGSAADQAGLKVKDVVVAVNGVETAGRTAFDIIDQISEDPNAGQVTFTIKSQGEDTSRDVTMKREFLEVRDPISYRVTETRADGTKVGYVRIAEFNSIVKPKLEAALRDLESQNVNAYVLDVRGNPGGAFQSAVEIAGLFMDNKLATDVVDGNGVDLKFRTSKDRVVIDPTDTLVIWVDGRSASASEVLSGALRDNCRAIVMGDTSFGKGLVQAVYGLKNGYGLVLTVAKYLTPGGTDINKVGIIPDVSKEEALPSAPGYVPLIGSDTSRVDFQDVMKRLDPSMCPRIE
jgi:carboxyl-terminal processing protease